MSRKTAPKQPNQAQKAGSLATEHLKPDTQRWFEEVTAEYLLEAHHVRLLLLACLAWDRASQAREQLARDGLTFVDRLGSIRSNPANGIEDASRTAFARLVRELNLDVEGPTEERSRPPALRGRAGLRVMPS
jgi:phage terminase small subunit